MSATSRPGDPGRPSTDGDDTDAPLTRREHKEHKEHETESEGPPTTRSAPLRRSLGLTALGTLFPGAGLALTRRRPLGLVLLVLALLLLVGTAWYVVRQGAESAALSLGSRPDTLQTLGIVMAFGMLVWMASVALTALTTRPRPMSGGQRAGLSVFTGMMCLLLAAPAAVGLRYIDAHSDAVDKIFIGRSHDQSASTLATPDLGDEKNPWSGTPRVNLLMLGSDAGENREGVRTDSMLVASIDTQTGDAVLFGIPRNLEKVPIPADNPLSRVWPQGYNCGDACLMNGIWTEAEAAAETNPGWYPMDPNPGLTATQDVIGEILGLPIDYTVIVNLEGFQDLVDAMGGVDINVQERLPMGGRTTTTADGRPMLVPGSESGYLEPGEQHLTGYQALWYARSRITTDDFSRMRRQRCVVAAVIEQVNPLTMIQRYPQVVGVAGDNVRADISRDELPAWAELVQRVQNGSIKSLPFTVQNTDVGDPNYTAIRARVQDAIDPPPPPTITPSPPSAEETPNPEPSPASTPEETPPAPTEDALEDVGVVC